MKRKIYKDLCDWKESPDRKPLMMYGARQVGKTYILKEFGRNEFENMVYINCYANSAMNALFSGDIDVKNLILGLSAISGVNIEPGKTFVFLDEAQEIPRVVASLKYFCEQEPGLAVAVAGSLLGVLNMEGNSFPTGKVDMMHLYPMTFPEFLMAVGEEQKAALIADGNTDLINALLQEYTDLLRQYYFVGGMPEAVARFVSDRNLEAIRNIQKDILSAYEADIAKHAGRDSVKARLVLQSIPGQLAKENKKFVFGALRKGARVSEFENAIQWLTDAGLVYKICRVSKVAMPLNFYKQPDIFKLFLLDVGLIGAMAQVPASLILIGNNVFTEYKGAFTENYVLTQLIPDRDISLAYYSKDNSSLEIDFVVQCGDRILPLEVKAEENVRSKSLRQFVTVDNAGTGMHGYKTSMKGFDRQSWVTSIPLPAISVLSQSPQTHETGILV